MQQMKEITHGGGLYLYLLRNPNALIHEMTQVARAYHGTCVRYLWPYDE